MEDKKEGASSSQAQLYVLQMSRFMEQRVRELELVNAGGHTTG